MRKCPLPVKCLWSFFLLAALTGFCGTGCGSSEPQPQAVWVPDGNATVRNIKRLEYDPKHDRSSGMYAIQEEKGQIKMWWLPGQAGHITARGTELTIKIDVPADQLIWAEKSYYKSSLDKNCTCTKTVLHVRSLDDIPK